MKSSTGAHYLGLDHIRGLAALMVVSWHFVHGQSGYPVPFGAVPVVFPLVFFDEGHVGVALFMTLSGYLFAKLLDGKDIDFAAFLWNRCLRLLPLLALVMLVAGVQAYRGHWLVYYLDNLRNAWFAPTLPNGGWSITTEFHFYLVLPLLLWLSRRSALAPLAFVGLGIAVRSAIYLSGHPLEPAAYWTIIGRIDQFAWGIVAFSFSRGMAGRHAAATVVALVFCAVYLAFDRAGGYTMSASPARGGVWIVLPTIEGACFGTLIAWYDRSFEWRRSRLAVWLSKPGEYSYSIYLLHTFLVFKSASLIDQRVMGLSNFYVALLWSFVFFAAMMPIGYLSYRWVEMPFMRFRRRYAKERSTATAGLRSIST